MGKREAFLAATCTFWSSFLAAGVAGVAQALQIPLEKALSQVEACTRSTAENGLRLSALDADWPRETIVTFDLLDQGRLACLDVDLPEIEDMPKRTATVPQRGMRLSIKELSPTKVQRMYGAHVHGVAFRLIGETFAALPMLQKVVLSGYSQRRSAITGHVTDEYLLSVRVTREQWSSIDDEHLQAIDVMEALAQFEMRRTMSKTGVFKATCSLSR